MKLRDPLLRLTAAIIGFSGHLGATPLHLDFLNLVEDKPLLIDSLRYQNGEAETFSVTRLDWLATDFTLVTEEGEKWNLPKQTALVSTRGSSYALPDLPNKRFTSLSFHVGPNKEINHSDPAQYSANHPLNPNLNNLHWDWQGGYIFLAIEGHWRAKGEELPGGFAYHFANDRNRTRITLPIDLTLNNESRIAIALDPQKLLAGLSFAKDGATTHSQPDDPVAERLKRNLQTAFRVVSIQEGGLPETAGKPKPIDLPANPMGYPITLPKHIPLPALPSDNPILSSRVALGKELFNEPLLSRTNTLSCASCHQGKTLSDPRSFSLGTEGQLGTRHSMPLFNLAWKTSFFWDGRAPSLREQALVPIEDHLEMDEDLTNVISKLKAESKYPPLFANAFGSGAISAENLGLAIEAFLLTQLSLDSKLDQARKGQEELTEEEQRGFELFFTESEPRLGKKGADCFHCHGGALFSDHSFHNNGLPPTDDIGLEKTTGKESDRYKFSTPSLRNIALTAPYMHDGRFRTLEEVIAHYNNPIPRSRTLDPNLAKHPNGLGLSEEEQAALVAFLKTLTDPALVD
ncbi:MbnP family protein [Roseibacillus persicicus]|uniref:MbnP family protein n=1 Tax=Roseibacillus persicicus TaxID=454148 RepID=UPI00280D9679|nr:MbnP family protein [Roseibacillus persicicus]MDQ8192110.1 cytochrome c peroxidase [Roseibacillus persicicus]